MLPNPWFHDGTDSMIKVSELPQRPCFGYQGERNQMLQKRNETITTYYFRLRTYFQADKMSSMHKYQ